MHLVFGKKLFHNRDPKLIVVGGAAAGLRVVPDAQSNLFSAVNCGCLFEFRMPSKMDEEDSS